MRGFLHFVDRISYWSGHAFSWCIMILIFGMSYEVLMRRFLGAPTTWAYDISYMMYAALFFMCGAYALSLDQHVRADMLYRKLQPRTQAKLDLVLYVLFFFPGVIALVFKGTLFAMDSWRFHEVSVFSPANIPRYPMKTLIPLGGALLLLQGIAECVRAVECIKANAWPPRVRDVEELEKQIIHQHAGDESVAAEASVRRGPIE